MNILNLERSKKSSPAGLYVYLDQVKILDQLPELYHSSYSLLDLESDRCTLSISGLKANGYRVLLLLCPK